MKASGTTTFDGDIFRPRKPLSATHDYEEADIRTYLYPYFGWISGML